MLQSYVRASDNMSITHAAKYRMLQDMLITDRP